MLSLFHVCTEIKKNSWKFGLKSWKSIGQHVCVTPDVESYDLVQKTLFCPCSSQRLVSQDKAFSSLFLKVIVEMLIWLDTPTVEAGPLKTLLKSFAGQNSTKHRHNDGEHLNASNVNWFIVYFVSKWHVSLSCSAFRFPPPGGSSGVSHRNRSAADSHHCNAEVWRAMQCGARAHWERYEQRYWGSCDCVLDLFELSIRFSISNLSRIISWLTERIHHNLKTLFQDLFSLFKVLFFSLIKKGFAELQGFLEVTRNGLWSLDMSIIVVALLGVRYLVFFQFHFQIYLTVLICK